MNSYIESLKQDDSINRIKSEDGNFYGIRVLGRGENLFFQENDKALICQINAVNSVIFVRTIRNWDGEKRMSNSERERVTDLIVKYYKEVYNPNVALSEALP